MRGKTENNTTKYDGDVSDVILREDERLDAEIKVLKSRNLRIWILVILVFMSIAFLAFASLKIFPKYRFIPATESICSIANPVPPSNAILAEYAKEAVVAAYSYDYVNYRDRINYVAAKYFTNDGRISFMKSIDESKNLELVVQNRLILKAQSTITPQVETTWEQNGHKFWSVRVPMQIAFYSNGDVDAKKKQNFFAIVNVTQTPISSENFKGLGIDALVLSPDNTKTEQ